MSTYTSIDKKLKSDLIEYFGSFDSGAALGFYQRLVDGKPRGRKKPVPPADILISN